VQALEQGLPDFSWYNIPKRGEMFQITTKISNEHKLYQMAAKYLDQMSTKFQNSNWLHLNVDITN
jgi:hypothetical protein